MECTNCNQPIVENIAHITNEDGTVYHVDCYPEPTPEPTVEE